MKYNGIYHSHFIHVCLLCVFRAAFSHSSLMKHYLAVISQISYAIQAHTMCYYNEMNENSSCQKGEEKHIQQSTNLLYVKKIVIMTFSIKHYLYIAILGHPKHTFNRWHWETGRKWSPVCSGCHLTRCISRLFTFHSCNPPVELEGVVNMDLSSEVRHIKNKQKRQKWLTETSMNDPSHYCSCRYTPDCCC